MLANQFKILARLSNDEDEAKRYEMDYEAIQQGYELEYKLVSGPDSDILSEQDCREVREILDMFSMIHFSLKKSGDESLKADSRLVFGGFDGNSVVPRYSYVNYLYRRGQWTHLTEDGWKNSHFPVIDMYRAMLRAWEGMGKPTEFDDDQLRQLSAASKRQ